MWAKFRKYKKAVMLFVFVIVIHSVTHIYRHGAMRFQPAQWASFDPKEPRYLLILAYQRTGSTYMGELLNQDPNVFYTFEPLDGLYTTMYGIPNGLTVPSDINHYRNGSIREHPADEIEAGSRLLRQFLTCDFNSLSDEILLHKFVWQFAMKSLHSYKACLRKQNITGEICKDKRPMRCTQRFGQNHADLQYCKVMLAASRDRANGVKGDIKPPKQFADYLNCFKEHAHKTKKCRNDLQRLCRRSKSRAVKTVRAPMHMAENLLRDMPNFRLVHLIRDPRGVYRSRKFDPSFRSVAGYGIKEAFYYCSDVLRDIRLRKRLEQQYPGRIMQIVYDEFMDDPRKNLQRLYSFLNRTIHKDVGRFVSRTNKWSMSMWTKELSFASVRAVDKVCKEMYKETRIEWLGTS